MGQEWMNSTTEEAPRATGGEPAQLVTRRTGDHLDRVTVNHRKSKEHYFTIQRKDGDGLSLFEELPSGAGTPMAQIVFGGCQFHDVALTRLNDPERPLMWLQGDVCPGRHVSGTQVFTLEAPEVRPVVFEGKVVGSAWSDADADYCLLAGILPADPAAGRTDQTRTCFERMEAALAETGMDFSHVVRTWLYLDHLLDWYDEFNAARTAFFHARGVFDRLVPASTGIGASNPAGAALVAGALAVRPRHGAVRIQEVGSPLQGPATDYRSSFSRAVEVAVPGRRTLLISGTASIAPDGRSLHTDDVVKQIHLTLDVVEGLLAARGMTWSDTTRAIGYFHDIADLPQFETCCRERGISPLPMLPVHATVCRHDLLFELELDAVVAHPAPQEP